ncbi:MAG: hypothetical protein U9O78_04500 [Patescibacteria group bacterium]|nr:hypothetical protein [Patescibacteria group bacterium]
MSPRKERGGGRYGFKRERDSHKHVRLVGPRGQVIYVEPKKQRKIDKLEARGWIITRRRD